MIYGPSCLLSDDATWTQEEEEDDDDETENRDNGTNDQKKNNANQEGKGQFCSFLLFSSLLTNPGHFYTICIAPQAETRLSVAVSFGNKVQMQKV